MAASAYILAASTKSWISTSFVGWVEAQSADTQFF